MELHIHYIEKENKYEIKKQVTEKKIRIWKTVKAGLDESSAKEIARKGKFEGNKVISFPYSFV
jgi:hypothetical protein